MNKDIYVLEYSHSANLWDNIQSYVSKVILERLWYNVKFINQIELHKKQDKTIILFINWFFCFFDNNFKSNFPFNKNIHPIFSNFHLEVDYWKKESVTKKFFTNENKKYLKKYEPIWCRDADSADIFNENWVNAINNDCMTLLLDKRSKEDERNAKKIILVDVDEYTPIPKEYRKNYEYVSHNISNGDKLSNETKINISEDILEYYKKNAKLIITSRFHCAMPCAAMWIPVIFFWDNNSRLKQKYVKIYPYVHFWKRHKTLLRKFKYSKFFPLLNINIKHWFNILDILYSLLLKIYYNLWYKLWLLKIDWNIKALDFENEKMEKISSIKEKLSWI